MLPIEPIMTRNFYISFGPAGHSAEEKCSVTVIRGHVKIYITVEMARIAGTRFGEELQLKIKQSRGYRFGKIPPHLDPVFLIYQYCLPLIKKLAPQTMLQDLSLEWFLRSPTYNLELVDAGDNQDTRIDGENNCVYTPAFSMSPIRTIDLPEPCRAIPPYQASRTWISPSRDAGKSLDSAQGEVVTADDDPMWFKPRLEWREREFERELRIMSQINDIAHIQVPKLKGIVVSGDQGELTMGMLISLIPSSKIGPDLRSPELQKMTEFHEKWEKQVTATVRELHAHGIVWGDVNPSNVMIDEEMAAWVIDFGGMNNSDFVDDDKRETVEGDEQGIRRLFHEWLPRVSHEEITV